MKHAIILAHPSKDSFNASVAAAYAEAAEELGHACVTRDLYALGFDPVLKAAERPDGEEHAAPADVVREREILADCDVFAFIYPIWFGTPPAMMKGYVERVFNYGFAFSAFKGGRAEPLLAGRELVSFTTSGATKAWLEENGVWLSLRTIFDDYIAKVCGLKVADHVHFASIAPEMKERWVLENLETVRGHVRRLFGGRHR